MTGQDVHDAFFRFMPKGVAARTGTVLRSGWADGEFDAVLLCEVLEHCIDVPAAIAEMYRILCPSGQLIIIDKNQGRLDSWTAAQLSLQIQAAYRKKARRSTSPC